MQTMSLFLLETRLMSTGPSLLADGVTAPSSSPGSLVPGCIPGEQHDDQKKLGGLPQLMTVVNK